MSYVCKGDNMREIKFRAWDKGLKEYIYNVESIGVYASIEYDDYDFSDILIEERFEVEQYTGLKDKNNKEIYDGDIVESFVHPEIPIHYVVQWSDKFNGWFCKNLNNPESDYKTVDIQLWVYIKNNQFEVIGNIHENPELLV